MEGPEAKELGNKYFESGDFWVSGISWVGRVTGEKRGQMGKRSGRREGGGKKYKWYADPAQRYMQMRHPTLNFCNHHTQNADTEMISPRATGHGGQLFFRVFFYLFIFSSFPLYCPVRTSGLHGH